MQDLCLLYLSHSGKWPYLLTAVRMFLETDGSLQCSFSDSQEPSRTTKFRLCTDLSTNFVIDQPTDSCKDFHDSYVALNTSTSINGVSKDPVVIRLRAQCCINDPARIREQADPCDNCLS